jgi:large subunit ribosomal protein L28
VILAVVVVLNAITTAVDHKNHLPQHHPLVRDLRRNNMAKRCELTGKGIQVGNRVSHSNIKTKHRFLPNLQKKRFWSVEKKKFVTLRVCASTIRTIDKVGFDTYLHREKISV